MKILCVGMMVCDIPLATIPKNIFELDKCEIEVPKPSTGGDALNVAIALSKLGIESSLVGRVGDDYNGNFIKETAIELGVDISGVITDGKEATATSYVLIDPEKERHFLSHNHIFHKLTGGDITERQIKKTDIIYFGSAMVMNQMDLGGTTDLFKKAHKHGKITAMDTAMNPAVDLKKDKRLFSCLEKTLYETDLFLPSYEEARLISGETEPKAMAAFFQKYDVKVLVIKLGKQGCYVTDFSEGNVIKGFRNIKVLDTNGAGDSFVAGFLCGYTKHWSIFECATFANGIAAKNIGAIGATNGVPDFQTGLEFLHKYNEQ